jgi:acetyltransferase-like isoleucine patch superfamily enzyme
MFRYLWRGRAKYQLGSRAWMKAWAKRVLTARSAIAFARRRGKLIRGGAQIGESSCIGLASIEGRMENLRVGRGTTIGRAAIMLHGACAIGDYVCVNDGVTILTAGHDIDDPLWRHKKAEVSIGDYAWIATRALILPGVSIGRGAVVGAGAVVTKDVPPFRVVVGNPGRLTAKVRNESVKYVPTEFLAFQEAWLGNPNRYCSRDTH